MSISDKQGNLFTKCLNQNVNLWHWQFTFIENRASHWYLHWTKACKWCSWYVSTSLWQYFFNFICNHFWFCGRDWLQHQKIKIKWLWIFVKITYIYSDHFFPCSQGRFICKQSNILSMMSPFVYEFLEVGI